MRFREGIAFVVLMISASAYDSNPTICGIAVIGSVVGLYLMSKFG